MDRHTIEKVLPALVRKKRKEIAGRKEPFGQALKDAEAAANELRNEAVSYDTDPDEEVSVKELARRAKAKMDLKAKIREADIAVEEARRALLPFLKEEGDLETESGRAALILSAASKLSTKKAVAALLKEDKESKIAAKRRELEELEGED